MKSKLKSERTLEQQARYREYRKKLRHKNIEKERERDRIRKAKKRNEKKELVNEYQRKNYRNNSDAAGKQNERRQKREPNRILRTTSKLLQAGIIELNDAIERCDRAIEYSKQSTVNKRRSGRPQTIGVRAERSSNEHGNDGEVDASKD